MDIISKLTEFRNKSICFHSQRKADNIYKDLLPYLTTEEASLINSAREHKNIGEGNKELIDVVNSIINNHNQV
jgi:hypothetical protein